MAIHDNYLPCEQYSAAPESENYPGFKTWFDAETNHWYFAVVTNTGRVVLRSEGYSSEAGRNNGIESVKRNRDLEERYVVSKDEEDGNWYVILRAGNRQEIGRSCPYDSEEAANLGRLSCYGTYTEGVETAATVVTTSTTEFAASTGISETTEMLGTSEFTTSTSIESEAIGSTTRIAASSTSEASGSVETTKLSDDYLACNDYKDQPASSYERFTSFYNESDSQHYFALVDFQGNVLLRSEGYSSEAGRNNGIESVNRNRDNDVRYTVVKDEDGMYYVSLKAGNRQEIARSCGYTSEVSARAIIAQCFSTYSAKTVETKSSIANVTRVTSEPIITRSTSDANVTRIVSEPVVTRSTSDANVTRVVSQPVVTKSTSEANVTRVVAAPIIKQGVADPSAYKTVTKELTTAYVSKTPPPPPPAPIVVVPEPAPIVEDYLPCEAYHGKTASSFDGFNVFQNEKDSLYYFAMVDENGKVILKSEGYTTEKARDNGIESVMRNRDIKERWLQSKDEGGHYLSLRAGNRQEIARTCHFESEGSLLGWWMPFSTAWSWGRKVELVESKGEASSVESIQVASPVTETTVSVQVEERFAEPVVIPEPEPIVIPEPEPIIEIEKIAAVAAVAAIIPEIEVPKKEKEYQPQWKKKEKEKKHYVEPKKVVVEEEKVVYSKPVEEVKYVAPPVTAYVEPEIAEVAGGSGWWKWLLGALLLGALAFMLMKGCKGCNKTPKVEVPAVTVPTPAVETPAVVAPPAPAVAECNCSTNTDPLFNIGTGTPKSLSRLGTNPEFGNSHGLTPTEFLAKLTRASKRSETDKKFLDRVFKGMGYDGFADAKADMFTEVNFPAGTVGNIGYSAAHKTLFARLDTQPKDLEAFRIKSKNGCDFHFMKTCGNHMFTCTK
jgi:uncharacterized protein YegP (UPF0339 family)